MLQHNVVGMTSVCLQSNTMLLACRRSLSLSKVYTRNTVRPLRSETTMLVIVKVALVITLALVLVNGLSIITCLPLPLPMYNARQDIVTRRRKMAGHVLQLQRKNPTHTAIYSAWGVDSPVHSTAGPKPG